VRNDNRDLLGSGTVPLEQDMAKNLAVRSFGDLVYELDPPDPLVRRHPLGDPRHERLGGHRAARNHERFEYFTCFLVRAPDDSGVGGLRVGNNTASSSAGAT
jgi:hypothetical protein